jgi:glycosyltransferase involved in cell wall biosynthesis
VAPHPSAEEAFRRPRMVKGGGEEKNASVSAVRVLHIAGVGPFGGASRSLYEALRALPEGSVESHFIAPRGTAAGFYRRVAKDIIVTRGITRFDHGLFSYYRGTRWLVPLREIFHLPFTLWVLLKARRRWPAIDLVHINEFTEILPGLMAKALFKAPLVVHARSLVMDEPKLWRTRWLFRKLRHSADAIVAIDENVRATLPPDLPIDIVHNSFSVETDGDLPPDYAEQLDGLRPCALKVGFVGNLLRVKGLSELVAAARLVKEAGADVQFLIIGGASAPERGLFRWLLGKLGLAQSMRNELMETVASSDLGDDFILLGPTPEIQHVYPRMDVLAFPSHYDAPGRPVFEAAFFGVPSIVAVRHPREDTIIDGETAIAIAEPAPALLAQAILRLAADRNEVRRMGANARSLAERNFRPAPNARQLLAVFRRTIDRAAARIEPIGRGARHAQPETSRENPSDLHLFRRSDPTV